MRCRNCLAVGKTALVVSSLCCLLQTVGGTGTRAGFAQETPPAAELDGAKVAEFQQHWSQALQLYAQGNSLAATAAAEKALVVQKQLLGDADQRVAALSLWIGVRYWEVGEDAKAIAPIEKALAIQRKVDPKSQAVLDAMSVLATLHVGREDYARAEALYEELLELTAELHEPNHWRVVDARLAVEDLALKKNLSVEDRQRLQDTDRRSLEIPELPAAQGLELAARLAEAYKDILGETHPTYAKVLYHMGEMHADAGDLATAESLHRRSLQIRLSVVGETHPDYGRSLSALAGVYLRKEDDLLARPLLHVALAVLEQTLGVENSDYANALQKSALVLLNAGAYAESATALTRVAQIQQKALGDAHPDRAQALHNLGAAYLNLRMWDEGESVLRQALSIRQAVFGEQHHTCLDTRRLLFQSRWLQNRYVEAAPMLATIIDVRRQQLGSVHHELVPDLRTLGECYMHCGNYQRAEEPLREALRIEEAVGNPPQTDHAFCWMNLAVVRSQLRDHAEAVELCQRSLDLLEKLQGREHPSYAGCLRTMASIQSAAGNFAEAETRYREALDVCSRTGGETHPGYAECVRGLAQLCLKTDDNRRARTFAEQLVDLKKRAVGEEHADYAQALMLAAEAYAGIHDLLRAQQSYEKALQIIERAVGKEGEAYLDGVWKLALFHREQERYEQAESLYLQGESIAAKVLGENHPSYPRYLEDFAELRRAQGRSAQAAKLYETSLALKKKIHGKPHLAIADSECLLALCYQDMDEPVRALPGMQRALETRQAILGDSSRLTATTRENLADLHFSLHDFDRAEQYQREVLQALREIAAGWFDTQSEYEQFQTVNLLRLSLERYLRIAIASGRFAQGAYQQVIDFKGLVLMRQRAMRALAADPQLEPLFQQLQTVSSDLATQTFITPDPSRPQQWIEQIESLTRRKQQLERQLAAQSVTIRESIRQTSFDDLLSALPAGFALVDYMEYAGQPQRQPGQASQSDAAKRLLAFVIRKGAPVSLVDLGDMAAIREAITAWREGFGNSPEANHAGHALREQIWDPLVPKLAGAEVVLVSPDRELGRLPLAGLPGKQPGTYLLEQWAIAILPAPQALPELAGDPPESTVDGNVLLVGDVDYDARPDAGQVRPRRKFGRSINVRDFETSFTPLSATRGEIATIERMYRDNFGPDGITTLEAARASEEAFCREASQHLYLHVATHGFFMPAELRTFSVRNEHAAELFSLFMERFRLIANNPGVLSGLALAGANQPNPDGDDGILTAEEVATLNLYGVDLAVLSACDTGLGLQVGGEGLLGLQRSFQVAGARTVVASLWKVPDQATRDLMERFYDNLWNREMGKLEALREAQLWMLEEGVQRGAARLDVEDTETPSGRTPPKFWAGFVLSGDWR